MKTVDRILLAAAVVWAFYGIARIALIVYVIYSLPGPLNSASISRSQRAPCRRRSTIAEN